MHSVDVHSYSGHILSRGLLDYKHPVAEYWPEFAQNGKEKITVEMLFSHQVRRYRVEDTDCI